MKYVRSYERYFPFLIQSSDINNEKTATELKGKFLYKYSETLEEELKIYINQYFSFGDFEFWDPVQGKVLAVAKDLTALQKILAEVPIECITYHSKRSEYSKWLRSRALFPLANLLSNVEYDDFEDAEQVREYIIESIKMYRIFRSRGVISKFDKNTYDEYSGISRIGDGNSDTNVRPC